MNNHILTASEFQFSSSFFDNELEKVLRECVGIYTEIINKKITFPNDEENFHHIQVLVDSDDMGALIGREGKTAKAIRTIVQASGYLNGNKKIKIDIDSF